MSSEILNLKLNCQVQTSSGSSPFLLKNVRPSWIILSRSTLHLGYRISWFQKLIIFLLYCLLLQFIYGRELPSRLCYFPRELQLLLVVVLSSIV